MKFLCLVTLLLALGCAPALEGGKGAPVPLAAAAPVETPPEAEGEKNASFEAESPLATKTHGPSCHGRKARH